MSTAADPEPVIDPGPAPKSSRITATWHLKIVTGKEAQALLEMQNQVIISLLTWADGYVKTACQDTGNSREIGVNVSRETLELAA